MGIGARASVPIRAKVDIGRRVMMVVGVEVAAGFVAGTSLQWLC